MKFLRQRPSQLGTDIQLDYSLRSYLEMLYSKSEMKIVLRGVPVETRPHVTKLKQRKQYIHPEDARVVLTLGIDRHAEKNNLRGVHMYKRERLVQAYVAVGMMLGNSDIGVGVIGILEMNPNDGKAAAKRPERKCISCVKNWRPGKPSPVMATMARSDDETMERRWCRRCAEDERRNGVQIVDTTRDFVEWEHTKQKFVEGHDLMELHEWCARQLEDYWYKVLKREHLAITGVRSDFDESEVQNWLQCDVCRQWREVSSSQKAMAEAKPQEKWFCRLANLSCQEKVKIDEAALVTLDVGSTGAAASGRIARPTGGVASASFVPASAGAVDIEDEDTTPSTRVNAREAEAEAKRKRKRRQEAKAAAAAAEAAVAAAAEAEAADARRKPRVKPRAAPKAKDWYCPQVGCEKRYNNSRNCAIHPHVQCVSRAQLQPPPPQPHRVAERPKDVPTQGSPHRSAAQKRNSDAVVTASGHSGVDAPSPKKIRKAEAESTRGIVSGHVVGHGSPTKASRGGIGAGVKREPRAPFQQQISGIGDSVGVEMLLARKPPINRVCGSATTTSAVSTVGSGGITVAEEDLWRKVSRGVSTEAEGSDAHISEETLRHFFSILRTHELATAAALRHHTNTNSREELAKKLMALGIKGPKSLKTRKCLVDCAEAHRPFARKIVKIRKPARSAGHNG
eukprot:SAG11_NODE_739_length_7425_cov_67.127082_6_plen_680_part_00